MPQVTEDAVYAALRTVQEPELGGDLVTRNMIKDLVLEGNALAFTIELTTPACPLKDEIESRVHAALDPIGVESIDLTWGSMVRRAAPRTAEQLLPGVKNVIAVASGKGGVGKSTVAVNLAVALARDGAAVGLLDADITGPNVPIMLGLDGQPGKSANEKILPLERHGVKAISIQFFVPAGQPIIWRGPLVGGAIQQFLRDVEWGELDYLVIDLPPGTSDAQLTLAQAVPIGGTVLVTTPQDVALMDVQKALGMFRRMSVP
ncbi:MAG: Mrp/NBP35 family ATP-binding protein, partial [Candidatus Limnocylindrales bacterium]